MCGIVGAIAFGKVSKREENRRQKIMKYFTTELLLLTESRGKDATGAAILFQDGNFVGIKRGEKVSSFLSKFGKNKECYGSLMEIWDKHESPVKVYLGHCRASTIGSKFENENNHPIKIGNLVGVHNGVIKNDDTIIKNLQCKRDGKVDSEAIFRLFEYYTKYGKEPFTMEMLKNIVNRLEGQFAVTLFNADNPYQIPIFRDGRPAAFVFIKDLKLLFIVSELEFWNKVHVTYENAIEYHNSRRPSLLDMDIEKEILEDDSGIIFDLETKIDKDTKILELGEWKKIPRTNKIWQTSKHTTTYSSVGYSGYHGYSSYNKKKEEDEKSKAKPERKPTRIFDKITKKYSIKGNEEKSEVKDLKAHESAVIVVNKDYRDNKNEDNNKTLIVGYHQNETEIESTDQEKDIKSEHPLAILDSSYQTNSYENDSDESKGKDTDSIDNNSTKKNINNENINNETELGQIVSVDMNLDDSPELYIKARDEYNKLPLEQKGYKDISEVLDATDIPNEKMVKNTPIIMANKVFAKGWKQGFVIGCKNTFKELTLADGKVGRRERYIGLLKSMVVILSLFYNNLLKNLTVKTKNHKDFINEDLASIAMEHLNKNSFNLKINEMLKLFNEYEKGKVEKVAEIIAKASYHGQPVKKEGE
jgi:amidophosphoribosyltransferase